MRAATSSEPDRSAAASPDGNAEVGAGLLRFGAMDLPAPLKGLAAMRLGVGVTAIAAPQALALAFGLPAAGARTPMAVMGSAFFGVRELALVGITAGATKSEPRALRRLLVVSAATDALDLTVLGLRSIRQPPLRRALLLAAPAALASIVLHLRAAQDVEITP